VLSELFWPGVTVEALRAKIDWKSAFCKGVSAKFSRWRGRPPPIIFARIDRPMNALTYNFIANSCHTKKLFSRLSSSKVRFCLHGKRPFCVFEFTFVGVRDNVQCSSWLIGKVGCRLAPLTSAAPIHEQSCICRIRY